MADDSDLVSQIKITGGDTSAQQIEQFAEKGSAAFDKLSSSAAAADKSIAKSTTDMSSQASKAQNAISNAFNKLDFSGFSKQMSTVQEKFGEITATLPRLTQAAGRFAQRFAIVGAGLVATGVKLASVGSNVAKALDGQNDSLDKLTQQQIEANNQQLNGQIAAINYESEIRKLNLQLAQGKITYQQYSDSVKQLNQSYAEQQRVARQVAAAQAAVKEENDRLTKSLADQKAYQQLIDKFGGPLVTALAAFGRTADQIKTQITNAFGPAVANLIDKITGTLQKNGQSISSFFDQAAQKLNALVNNNGPALEKFFANVGKAAASILNGLIDALPALLDFFNNQLTPAITKLVGFVQSIADAFNAVFGTKVTAGSIVLIAIFAQMTGSIRILFALLRSGGTIIKATTSLFGAFATALSTLFGGGAVTANVIKFGVAITNAGGVVKIFFAIIRTGIPLIESIGVAIAGALGISLGTALAIIVAVGAALYLLYTQVDWAKWGEKVKDAWNTAVVWFNQAKDVGSAAAGAIQNAWQAVVTWFATTWKSISDTVAAVWTAITDGATKGVQLVIDAWNGLKDGFDKVVQSISDAWTNTITVIKDAWQAGLDSISSTLAGWYNTAVSYLQPIIDMLKAIAALTSSDSSSTADSSSGYAGGGQINGPGTGTSDSIPIWASNGEFMIRARAVQKYGASFMRAINSGSFNPIRGYAAGGLIGPTPMSPAAAYAQGGDGKNNPALSPLNLSIFGEQFKGLMMPADVGRRLTKFAIEKQTTSGGRKPAWVGGGKN